MSFQSDRIVNTCFIKKCLASFLCSCFPDSEALHRAVYVLKEAMFGSASFRNASCHIITDYITIVVLVILKDLKAHSHPEL